MPARKISRFDNAGIDKPATGRSAESSATEIVDRRISTGPRSDDVPVEISSPKVRRLFDYWKSRRLGRAMPSRRDIEPFEISTILPYVAITELHAEPLRVRFRLAGSVIDELHHGAVTGQWLDDMEVLGGHDFWLCQYARLMGEKSPIFGTTVGYYRGTVATTCDWTLLPMSSNEIDVDLCLELEDWDTPRDQDLEEAAGTRWQITVF